MSNSWDDTTHDIQNCFWILPVFREFQDIQSFKNFLNSKNISQDEMVISGFKLLIKQVLSGYLLDLELDSFLDLAEDRETRRALFHGVDYNKFSSASEKAHLLRNLRTMFQDLRRSRDFDALQSNLNIIHQKFFMLLEKIFNDSVAVDKGISIDRYRLLKLFGMLRLLSPAMNTISYDEASIDHHNIEVRGKKEQRFIGYKAGLAFLLRYFVNDDKLLSDIISANLESLPGIISSTDYKIVDQIRQETGRKNVSGKFFVTTKKPDKTLFGEIIRESSIQALSLNEQLDQLFLWYRFEVIDSGPSKIFSGGPAFRSLLCGEIAERVENNINKKLAVIRFRHPGDTPFFSYAVLLERFGTLSDFSGWMVFIKVGGDYNGLGGFEYTSTEQLLSKNIEHVDIREFEIDLKSLMNYIEKRDPDETVEMKSHVDIREFEIDLKSLMNYIEKRDPDETVEMKSHVDIREFEIDLKSLMNYIEKRDPDETVEMKSHVDILENSLNDVAGRFAGRLIEFIIKSYYEELGYESKIYFNDPEVLNNRKEIDILALNHKRKQIVMVECSTNIGVEINTFINEMNDKEKLLRSSTKFKEFTDIKKVFVTSDSSVSGLLIGQDIVKKIEDAGIEVLTIEEIVERLPKRFRRETLLQLFKSRKRKRIFRFVMSLP